MNECEHKACIKRYEDTLKVLKTLDEKQLLEMFHDLNDIKAVERIADCAFHYCENHVEDDDPHTPYNSEMSDEEDAISVDDARRRRELK